MGNEWLDRLVVRSSQDLGAQVRRARKAQGLTQAELAEIAGVGVRFVSELERGKSSAQLGLALELARLAGVDLVASPRRELGRMPGGTSGREAAS